MNLAAAFNQKARNRNKPFASSEPKQNQEQTIHSYFGSCEPDSAVAKAYDKGSTVVLNILYENTLSESARMTMIVQFCIGYAFV
jgi:hypothetical protein